MATMGFVLFLSQTTVFASGDTSTEALVKACKTKSTGTTAKASTKLDSDTARDASIARQKTLRLIRENKKNSPRLVTLALVDTTFRPSNGERFNMENGPAAATNFLLDINPNHPRIWDHVQYKTVRDWNGVRLGRDTVVATIDARNQSGSVIGEFTVLLPEASTTEKSLENNQFVLDVLRALKAEAVKADVVAYPRR